MKRELIEKMRIRMGNLGVISFVMAVLLCCCFDTSSAADFLTASQNLSDGATLVSEKGIFELGFFSPGNSTNRYLGIWYKIVPIRTVVWVANRENPINDSSGALNIMTIPMEGISVVLVQNKTVIWSAKSLKPVRNGNPRLQLLDSGNLVLKDANSGEFLWQSFDFPTDTLLPGMKLGWDFRHGINRWLSAWKSSDDPSPGTLTMGMTNTSFPELVMMNGSQPFVRSGRGQLSAKPTSALPILVYSYVNNESELSYSYELTNSSLIGRMVLNQTVFRRDTLLWSESEKIWRIYATMPRDACDIYGLCGGGAFGSCDIERSPFCQCLKGFKPMVFSQGCDRNTPLNCSDEFGFAKYTGMKLPDTMFWVNKSMSPSECREKCLRNCSCTAYANTDITGSGSGCAIWYDDLIDMKVIRSGGQDLYVRILASELETKQRSSVAIRVIAAITTTVLVIVTLLLIWFCIRRSRKRSLEGKGKVNLGGQGEDLELPLFDLTTISNATGAFSNSNKLGEGGFGAVFWGRLADGKEIAVKRLSSYSKQGTDEFKNEVILIAKLQHRNLVKLLGCCIQGEEKMLIYEYMPNKSLDYFIFDSARRNILDWSKRFNIICGIARGILYLHQDSRLRIIHRDLKASNILLDVDMTPKISDFGTARTCSGDQTEGNTRKVVGTYGYMAPEYVIDGQFSIKSDVFSFGILLLEIISGKKNREFYGSSDALNLIGQGWKLWKDGRATELIDASLGMEGSNALSEILQCIHVSFLCLQRHPVDRPTMADVVQMLNSDSILAQPKQPGFYLEGDSGEANSLVDKIVFSTNNGLTITHLKAR